MFIVRRGTLADVDPVVELAVESVSKSPLPLVIDREAIQDTIREVVSGNQHFGAVAEVDGRIVGALGAATQPGFWHQRNVSSVLMFYARQPGAGIALMREYARWVKSRPGIKVAIFSLEHDMDPRIGKVLQRLGFTLQNPQYSYVRGLEG